MAHGISGTLGVGVLAEVSLEVIFEDGLQSAANMFAAERHVDAIQAPHPRTDDAVGYAAGAVLIFRTFAFQKLLHFAALFIDFGDELGERSVAQALILDFLLVILTVEELPIHEARRAMRKLVVEFGILGLADSLRHLRKRGERSEINAGAHAIGAPELDVVSVVMGLEQRAAMIRIPSANTIVQAALGQRIHFLEPVLVARDLPIAKNLHDASKLAIGSGMEIVFHGTCGKRGTKRDVAVLVHRSYKFQFA